jgi:hypothetical protein
VHLRGETPGGKPFPVADDGGLPPVAAETVAKSSLRTTNTQADITGNIEPCGYNQHRARMSIGELLTYICSTRLRRERSSRSCLALRLSPEVSAVLKASSASARRASRRATSGSVVPLSSSAWNQLRQIMICRAAMSNEPVVGPWEGQAYPPTQA